MSSSQAGHRVANAADGSVPVNATLGQFIEANSKLVTSVAAFVALTAFFSRSDNDEVGLSIAALAFIAAVLLGFELMRNLPPPPRHWRLELFAEILVLLVIMMGWYWFSKFPTFWAPMVGPLVFLALILALVAAFTYLVTNAAKLIVARAFRRPVTAEVMSRVSLAAFLVGAALILVGWILAGRKLAEHPLTIHIPAAEHKTMTK